MKNRKNESTFSVELRSKDQLGLNLPKDVENLVVIEGTLGNLQTVEIIEGVMLEIKGNSGVFRMDIAEADWNRLLKKESGE